MPFWFTQAEMWNIRYNKHWHFTANCGCNSVTNYTVLYIMRDRRIKNESQSSHDYNAIYISLEFNLNDALSLIPAATILMMAWIRWEYFSDSVFITLQSPQCVIFLIGNIAFKKNMLCNHCWCCYRLYVAGYLTPKNICRDDGGANWGRGL